MGSGDVRVWATPALVALMECAAAQLLADYLDTETTSVGTQLSINHCAATPVGMEVSACAEVVSVEGRTVTFHVRAWDGVETVGEGTHSRVVLNRQRFEEKAAKKVQQKE